MRLIQQIQAYNEGGIVSKLSSEQRQNATLIYNTLISEGIPRTVVLGILGNVMQESSMNPQASTNLYTGFVQWDKNRLPNLQKFAKDLGTDIYDPTTQAKFIAHELKNQYKTVLEEASKVNTPQAAAEIIAEKYEVAGDKSSYKKRGQYATDFSGMFGENKDFSTKSSNVNISNVHNNLTHYLRTLPQNLQQKILITSGNDQGHSETSRHYKNRAVDLRFDDELYNYVKTDPNRLKYGITLLDPNHGTAPHLHLSYGEGTENKKDVWKDPFSPDRDWEVIDLSNEDLDNINQNAASPYLTYEEIIDNRISPADIWEMYKDEPSKAAELIAFKNEYEERLQKEAQEEKQAEIDLQKQALAQAQAEKQMVQKLLTTPTTPQEDYNAQIAQPQQPTQPFRFQTDWFNPMQEMQRGGTKQGRTILQRVKQSKLNPKNWGVTDYTDKGDFNTAYSAARKAGEKEFMWNGKRFSTKYDGTPEQQLKETGITDKQRLKPNIIRDRMEENIYDFEYHTRDPIDKMVDVVWRNKKEEDYLTVEGEIPESSKTHKDFLSLYLGKPQKYNTVSISKYKPSVSKEKDKEYFSINSEYFIEHILNHLQEDFITEGIKDGLIKPAKNKNGEVIPNRYVTTDVGTGLGEFTIDRGKDEHGEYLSYWDEWDLNPYKGKYSAKDISDTKDLSFGIGKPFDVYGRVYYRENPKYVTYQKIEKEIDEVRDKAFKTQDPELRKKLYERFEVLWKERAELDRFDTSYAAKYIRQYYSDKELSELDIDKKNFDTLALQRELSNRGYKLPNSTKEDGTFDGILGEETLNALKKWQEENKQYQKGGTISPLQRIKQKFQQI